MSEYVGPGAPEGAGQSPKRWDEKPGFTWVDGKGWVSDGSIDPNSLGGAVLQGKLGSWAWDKLVPEINQLVPGYSSSESLPKKVMDYGSAIFYGMPKNALLGPLESFEAGMAAPPGSEEQLKAATETALGVAGLGLGVSSIIPSEAGLRAFPAWHGTGVTFSPTQRNPLGEFSWDFMGRGAGDQWQGYGGYVGSQRGTGEFYRDISEVTAPHLTLDGKQLSMPAVSNYYDEGQAGQQGLWAIAQTMDGGKVRPSEAKQFLQDQIAALKNGTFPGFGSIPAAKMPQYLGKRQAGIDWIDQHSSRVTPPSPVESSLYNIWIKPDHYEFLDWDRPMAEQEKGVIERLRAGTALQQAEHGGISYADFENKAGGRGKDLWRSRTGKNFYRDLEKIYNNILAGNTDPTLAGARPDALASQHLDDEGIPGNRYLDKRSKALPQEVWALEGKPLVSGFATDSSPMNIAGEVLHGVIGTTKEDKLQEALRHLADAAGWEDDVSYSSTFDGPNKAERVAAYDWLLANQNKVTLGPHPNATHNYVLFHPRHALIYGRNGQVYHFDPVSGDVGGLKP